MISKGSKSKLYSILSVRKIGGNRGEGTTSCPTRRVVRVTKVGGGEPFVGGQTMNRRRVGGWLTLAGAESSKARVGGGGMGVGGRGRDAKPRDPRLLD